MSMSYFTGNCLRPTAGQPVGRGCGCTVLSPLSFAAPVSTTLGFGTFFPHEVFPLPVTPPHNPCSTSHFSFLTIASLQHQAQCVYSVLCFITSMWRLFLTVEQICHQTLLLCGIEQEVTDWFVKHTFIGFLSPLYLFDQIIRLICKSKKIKKQAKQL